MGEQKDRHKKSPHEGKDHAKSFTEGNRENEGAKTLLPCFPSVENETSVEMKWRKNHSTIPKGLRIKAQGWCASLLPKDTIHPIKQTTPTRVVDMGCYKNRCRCRGMIHACRKPPLGSCRWLQRHREWLRAAPGATKGIGLEQLAWFWSRIPGSVGMIRRSHKRRRLAHTTFMTRGAS